MPEVPLSYTDHERIYADLPPAVLKNRVFEETPTQAKATALLARPGTDELGAYGDGPIRACYSLTGLHGGALFFVSGDTLYRRDTDGTTFAINGTVFGTGAVSMTGVKGADYERLFIADGSHLQMYAGGSNASGVLTATAHVSNGDTVRIGDTYYQWVDADSTGMVGNGAGTSSNPWKVLRGASLADDLDNMVQAISFVGTPGVDWSANLGGQNADVTATADTTLGDTMTVTAKTDLTAGNSIVTTYLTSDTVPAASWGGGTLSGGGLHGLNGIEVPDGQPPISLTTLKSFVLIAIADSDRFYWIEPGEIVVDALDFATAESQPDRITSIFTVGDTAWLVGDGSTEIWYATGDSTAPFAPVTGRVYDRGAIEGTAVNIKGTVFLVGPDFIVYAISGGPQRVSNHGIEETIRRTLEAES